MVKIFKTCFVNRLFLRSQLVVKILIKLYLAYKREIWSKSIEIASVL